MTKLNTEKDLTCSEDRLPQTEEEQDPQREEQSWETTGQRRDEESPQDRGGMDIDT